MTKRGEAVAGCSHCMGPDQREGGRDVKVYIYEAIQLYISRGSNEKGEGGGGQRYVYVSDTGRGTV